MWAGAVLEDYLDDMDLDISERGESWEPTYSSFKDIRDTFLAKFQPFKDERRAQADLDALRQGTTLIEDFLLIFRVTANRANTDDDMSLFFFCKALRPTLLDDVERMNPPPEDLDSYIAGARQRDQRYCIRLKEKAQWGGGADAAKAKTPEAKCGPPATLSTTLTEFKKIGKMTEADCEELTRPCACFFCKEIRHERFDCPQILPERHQRHGDTNWQRQEALMTTTSKLPSIHAMIDALKNLSPEEREKATNEFKSAGF